EVDADQPSRCQAPHRIGDAGALIPTLRDVAGVPEPAHQLGPRRGDPGGVPTDLSWLRGEPIAWDRGDYQVECVVAVAAVRRRVGERTDQLEQLEHRAGPTVRDDQR